MVLFPAIDLKDGACVRLKQGDMAQATVFNDAPAKQAQAFEGLGFSWLHVVDLNGAFVGRPVNDAAVDAILGGCSLPVQLGGGIRDRKTIDMWLEKGVQRVVIGTSAVRDPVLVREAARDWEGRIAVALDAREGRVAVDGWVNASDLSATEMALRFEDAKVAAIIHTDIDRDGVLTGLNIEAHVALSKTVTVPVIASGGLAGMGDLKALKTANAEGIVGVIAGRALYDGRLDAREALAFLAINEGQTPC
ncbi:MAG: 1-(5-phosphoribosyl)-5-[(5-phosphoribosylamino)methylideneamino]imidazole-4-carboxamide isomerase [Parvularculales bacterium]